MDDTNKIIDAAARFARETQGQPQVVQPAPIPMTIQMGQAQGADGKKYVLLIVYTQQGQTVFHFEPDGAEKIAAGLIDTARLAKTGLEVPRLS